MAESDPSEAGLKALRLKVPRGYATRGLRTSERNPGVNRPLLRSSALIHAQLPTHKLKGKLDRVFRKPGWGFKQ